MTPQGVEPAWLARSGKRAARPSALASHTPAIGDEAGHEVVRRHVECGVPALGALRRHLDVLDLAPSGASQDVGGLARGALLDGDLGKSVLHRPVDRRRGEGDVERHRVVARRERLEIRPDLVADVSPPGRPVRPHDHHVDEPMLHQVTARVVHDVGVGDPVAPELPRGEGPLVAGDGSRPPRRGAGPPHRGPGTWGSWPCPSRRSRATPRCSG